MIPVGSLVPDPTETGDENRNNIIEWLDSKEKSSVVLVCFGSENYLSAQEVIEMANALETTKCNFIWAVRSALGEEKESVLLPDGFAERVGNLGLISSTGGFLSHCGWSSVNESIKFGVPIIGMPMNVDQRTNAKLAVEIGIGTNVRRDSKGKYKRTDEISDAIRKVLVDESGEGMRRKARELSMTLKEKGEEDLNIAVEKLVHICNKDTY